MAAKRSTRGPRLGSWPWHHWHRNSHRTGRLPEASPVRSIDGGQAPVRNWTLAVAGTHWHTLAAWRGPEAPSQTGSGADHLRKSLRHRLQ